MKRTVLLLLLLSSTMAGMAQKITPFKPLRYDEDYAWLKGDNSDDWYRHTKYNPLSKDGRVYISMGGEVRFQYFYIKNEGWGEEPADDDGFLLTRALVHADFHAGKRFRTFVQLQSSTANGRSDTSPVDEDPLELHQAFADFTVLANKKNKLVLRAGRQELSYGSQRLISMREGPNNRQSFDGIKSMFTAGANKVDLFYTHYVAAKKGIFDDGFNKDVQLWGAYLVKNKIPVIRNIDLYYLGIRKKKAVYDNVAGVELRHSIGTRIWGGKGTWQYDAEGVYQFGTLESSDISAWTASLSTSYKFARTKFKPEAGIKTEFISGDQQTADGKLNTFNPLFPRGAYFGLASLIGPANLFDIHPSLGFEITRKINWHIDYDIFWRYSGNDGLYAVNTSLIYSGAQISDKFIGQQYATDIEYRPNDHLYFRGEFTWFKAGDFLKKAGPGKDILFAGATVQFKF